MSFAPWPASLRPHKLPRLADLPPLPGLFPLLVVVMSYLLPLVTGGVVESDPATTLKCHLRNYQYRVTKRAIIMQDDILRCTGMVTVNSCWGRCESYEIGDFAMPYRLSYHPVCTFTGKKLNRVKLMDCDPGYPDPYYDYYEATGCECKLCDSDDTSCENLPAG